MIKVCSLDFLNKDFFETEVMNSEGAVLVSKGTQTSPEMILRLYFKEIYIKEKPIEKVIEQEEEITQNKKAVEKIDSTVQSLHIEPKSTTDNIEPVSESVIIEKVEEISEVKENEYLIFDEEQAKRVSVLSLEMGKILQFSDKSMEELQQAAYYHNIGRTKFTKKDLLEKDFIKKQSLAGYDILLNEKKLSEEIADTAKFYIKNYDIGDFRLNDEIPYAHIVSIASYYDTALTKNLSKEEVLKKMLQLGGNKFNIFVLHKFIKAKRDANE